MISALIAYRPTVDGWRDAAWRLEVEPYLERVCDEVIVETPEVAGDGSPDDFNKPAAINRARARASGDVLLIGDADTHPGDVPDMVRWLNRPWQHVPWVRPIGYRKLTEAGTRAHLYGPPAALAPEWIEWEGRGVCWSGGVVCRASDFDTAGGFDERYTRWGADDVAFGLTMNALVGPCERHPSSCLHYWHPTPEHRAQPRAQHDLTQAYMAAAEHPIEAARVHAMRRVRFGAP